MGKLRLIELFAGYGSQAMALKKVGIPFEHYKVIEFDKYAIKSYNAVHGTDFKTTDIRDISAKDLEIVDTDNYTYLLTYSFPCTDLSVAGKMEGMSKGSGTRSGLLWEVERILKECKELPQFLLMENVPQVHGKKNINDFAAWISFLDGLGYISKWQDLNAKDYGVAQNRNRCFMVSYLDKNFNFNFPEPFLLDKQAKDYLEDNVDEKYYLKSKKAQSLINNLVIGQGLKQEAIDLSINNPQIKTNVNCISARTDRGISNMRSEGTGVIVCEQRSDEGLRTFNDNLCDTIRTIQAGGDKRIIESQPVYKIRKMTPLECFRFMGVTDEDAYKMISVNTNTQCYKQAGNSIVVDVMAEIFKNLFLGGSEQLRGQMDIYDIL